jgi:hypothetical protein
MSEKAVKLHLPTGLHLKGTVKRIFSKLAVSVSYVSRKEEEEAERKKEVNGHVPF